MAATKSNSAGLLQYITLSGQRANAVVLVDAETGEPVTLSGGGGGGGGDASAANQVTQSGLLTNIRDKLAQNYAEDAAHTSGDTGFLSLGVRMDADTSPVSADGDYHGMIFNAVGRLKVSSLPADTAAVTGTITASAQTVAYDVRRQGGVSVFASGTFTGVNITFEASLDSTNGTDGSWFTVLGCRSNANVVESVSGVIATGVAYAWEFGVGAYAYFRVRSTAWASGTATITIKPGANATEPAPASQALPTGANTIGNVTVNASTNTIGGVLMKATAATSGTAVAKIEAAATTNATSVKATQGKLVSWQLTNNAAYAVFVKFYNKTSAPTVGTDVPLFKVQVPAGAISSFVDPLGYDFSLGIAYAVTKLLADSDTTAVVAGDVVGSIRYA